jgi:hypothetical protein
LGHHTRSIHALAFQCQLPAQVLLYLTPLHCQDMLDSVVTSLNATVAKFVARNPSFTVQLLLSAILYMHSTTR